MSRSRVKHQLLPNDWSQREQLRERGQFWTPDWVARAMVEYVTTPSQLIFDPAFGKGEFYSAYRAIRGSREEAAGFYGTDIDDTLVAEARAAYSGDPGFRLELRDFIMNPPCGSFASIVANPPYIRHHRLSHEVKATLRQLGTSVFGKPLDGRAGIHVYFLIQALRLLRRDGKLAFIMPSDTCEGVFSGDLWRWITTNYCLECVITFRPDATPFPNVDTNAVVFLVRNAEPVKSIYWLRVTRPDTTDLAAFVESRFRARGLSSLEVVVRDLDEGVANGLSRDPRHIVDSDYKLLHLATVMRGIATGANDFFLMTHPQASARAISPEFLKYAVGRTRDVDGSYLSEDTLENLAGRGRPTLLLALDGRPIEELPAPVQRYLHVGQELGLPDRPLIASRHPWYKMEQRTPPPFLFAYLGRRNARFIRNLAGVVPLTGFLCVYPRSYDPSHVEALWRILQSPDTVSNLSVVGKSYGSGALKIEPRALERLPIPKALIAASEVSEWSGLLAETGYPRRLARD